MDITMAGGINKHVLIREGISREDRVELPRLRILRTLLLGEHEVLLVDLARKAIFELQSECIIGLLLDSPLQ